MAMTKVTTLLRVGPHLNSLSFVNGFHTSPSTYLQQRWREEKGLTENPNTCGPLTDSLDYSYKDGRPVPLGIGQLRRMYKQQEYTKRIIQLVGEIDYAVERHEQQQLKEKERRQEIINSKLKPKGELLLKKKKETS